MIIRIILKYYENLLKMLKLCWYFGMSLGWQLFVLWSHSIRKLPFFSSGLCHMFSDFSFVIFWRFWLLIGWPSHLTFSHTWSHQGQCTDKINKHLFLHILKIWNTFISISHVFVSSSKHMEFYSFCGKGCVYQLLYLIVTDNIYT